MSDDSSQKPAVRLPSEISFDLDFPPLPRTMAEVTELVQDSEQERPISSLKEIVAGDPVVAPMVIKRVNSAFYGLRKKVSTAEQATVLLGFEEVHRLVVTASLMNLRGLFDSEEHLIVYRQIMRHSVATASFVRELAEELFLPGQEMAYTGGLLHAVGRLVLLYNVAETYEALWGSAGDREVPSVEDEEAIFGTNYAELGALGAEHWNMSDELRDLIRYHPDPGILADEENEKDPTYALLALALKASRDVSVPYARQLDSEVEPDDLEESAALVELAGVRNRSSAQLMDVLRDRQETIGRFVEMVLATE